MLENPKDLYTNLFVTTSSPYYYYPSPSLPPTPRTEGKERNTERCFATASGASVAGPSPN